MRLDATRAKATAATVVVAIAVVAAIASWWIGSRREAEHAANADAAVHDDARDRGIAAETASSAERSREPAMKSDPAENNDAPELDFDESKIHPIDGVVVLTDAHGKERRDADGEVDVVLDNRQELPQERVLVRGGRFHVDVRGGHAFGVRSAIFDGRPSQVSEDLIWWHSGPVITLHARTSRTFRLHLVDAHSLAELTNLSIVAHDYFPPESSESGVSPSLQRIARSGVVSPIDLEAIPDPEEVLWHPDLRATAPGYAPATFGVDFRNGGEQFVPLHRSASLHVTVIGAPEGASVSLNDPDNIDEDMRKALAENDGVEWLGDLRDWAPVAGSASLAFDDIPIGRYVVAVGVGGNPNLVISLAKQEIELVAGQTKEVTLRCRTIEHSAPAPIAGDIEVPAEWGDTPFELEISPARRPDLYSANVRKVPSKEMQLVDGSPRVFHWTAADVEPGDYRFGIWSLGASGEWSIGEKGRKDLRIVVGPCGEIAVRILDASTGSPIDTSSVHWESVTDCDLTREKVSDPYVGRVPIGSGTLGGLGGMQLVERASLEIHPGQNEFTLHARRSPALILELASDGWRVPWPEYDACGVEPIGHDGDVDGDTTDEDENKLVRFSDPGRYRITIPPIFGFEPVPPFEVDVPDGKPLVRKVELKRKL